MVAAVPGGSGAFVSADEPVDFKEQVGMSFSGGKIEIQKERNGYFGDAKGFGALASLGQPQNCPNLSSLCPHTRW